MAVRRRLVGAALVVGLSAGAAAACSSSGPMDASGRGSTTGSRSAAASTAGEDTELLWAPIVDGLRVQPGSSLLGATFPDPDPASRSGVRVALLAVDGDPAEVAGSYMQGLTAMGYRFASSSCGGGREFGQMIVCETPADPDTVSEAAAWMGFASPANGSPRFTTTIQLVIGPRGVPDVSTDGSTTLPRPPGTIITAAQAIEGVGGVDPVFADPPGVGELIADPSFDGGTGLVVEAGSELLAPAVPLDAGRAGWSAVGYVTGDPIAVADAYLAQRRWDWTVPASRDDTDGPVIRAGASNAGGASLELCLVPSANPADDGWWMLFTVTID